MGPVIIEGSPEALQTVAIPAPITSQIVSDTTVEPDVSLEVADVETDEQTDSTQLNRRLRTQVSDTSMSAS